MHKINRTQLKKGDTIIEVTIAFAIFSLVSIITVAMMNLGIATSERSLELVTARNEINAQAEAIRFIYNSYISESKLPECGPDLRPSDPCQKYKPLWDTITSDSNVIDKTTYGDNIKDTPETCNEFYDPLPGESQSPLKKAHAFVINARKLTPTLDPINAYFSITSHEDAFRASPLSSRIIYKSSSSAETSDGKMAISEPTEYTEITAVEGLWVVAVKGEEIGSRVPFYDFYIRSCWYGSNSPTYSSLDSVIRLYNAY